jgi:hypothetical protein
MVTKTQIISRYFWLNPVTTCTVTSHFGYSIGIACQFVLTSGSEVVMPGNQFKGTFPGASWIWWLNTNSVTERRNVGKRYKVHQVLRPMSRSRNAVGRSLYLAINLSMHHTFSLLLCLHGREAAERASNDRGCGPPLSKGSEIR